MNIGRFHELIALAAAAGCTVSVKPVKAGDPIGVGLVRTNGDDRYAFDGWEVGWARKGERGQLAVGETMDEAIEAAFVARREEMAKPS